MVIVKSWIPIVLFALVLLATGHPSSSLPPRVRQASSSIAPSSAPLLEPGFNAVAQSAGRLYFGTATNNYQLNDTAYVTILDDLAMFGQITPAKVMKWNYTEPDQGVFTWDQGDLIVSLARKGGKLMRGHNCVWYNDLPAWVTNTTWTAPELAEVVQEHCFNIVQHWAGQIWDVINEPFNDDGTWRETIWYNTLNTSYIPLALHAAHLADPHTKLYINEYNTTGPGPKASALKALVRELKATEVPLHGIGVQAHEMVGEVPPLADIKRNLEEFAALGVEVAITELDVRFAALPPDEEGLEQQRRDFETIVKACREVEGCVGITVWDWTDKYSWVPASFPGEGDACPFDTNLHPKPAYFGVVDGLQLTGNSLEYPSLDEPYYHTGQHTPDKDLVEALKGDSDVVAASMRIVAACGQLSTTVNKPWYGLMEDLLLGQFCFLEAANIVEILREAGPAGLHVREIYRLVLDLRTNSKTAAPLDTVPLTPGHLSHILRLLATGHYLREVEPDVFANNRASSYIDSGKTVSQLREAPEKKYNDTNGIAAYVGTTGDKTLKAISCLTEWALPEKRGAGRDIDTNLHTEPRLSQLQSAPGSSGTFPRYVSPFNVAFSTQLGLFSWFELPGNESRFRRFGHAMVGTRQYEIKKEVLRGFSWDDLPKGSVLVDVGGGIGSQSILVAEAHPHIHVVVEDREQVVSTARSAWGPQYAHLFESGRMSWRVRDFFEPWPALTLQALGHVDAPAAFLLRMILHDWDDADCNRILTRLRVAAGPHTKLLIGDLLLQHACAEDAAAGPGSTTALPFVGKDSPLLPNLGVANIPAYLMDILMMGLFDAKERTVDELTALLLSAGWKVVEVRRTPRSMWAYTTAVPV